MKGQVMMEDRCNWQKGNRQGIIDNGSFLNGSYRLVNGGSFSVFEKDKQIPDR
jgi:hypothetical protein